MFAFNFLKKPKQTGAILPSSKKLALAITHGIALESATHIVELGAGTGAFTQAIVQKKNKNAQFLAIEINEKMAQKLAKKISNVDIEVNCAQNLKEILAQKDIQKVDCIISGLPWTFFKDTQQDELLAMIYECLNEGGYFVAFVYAFAFSPFRRRKFAKKLTKTFGNVEIPKIVWKNFPPAIIYRCKK